MIRLRPILLLLIICGAVAAAGERTVTTRRHLKAAPAGVENLDSGSRSDTIRGEVAKGVRLSGFDKPLRSRYETVFAVNTTPYQVIGIVMTCDYADVNGRQLHRRDVTVSCDIPAGATRQLRFNAWDRQGSFYYRRSEKPRRAVGTAFDVTCTVKAIIIEGDSILKICPSL